MFLNRAKIKTSKIYSFDQYWNVHYTELFHDGTERDYKTIIKARSCDYVREILLKKVKEDNPNNKVKAFQCFMLTKDSSINNLSLNIKDWSHIRKASFPNISNILFKFLKDRPSDYTNRFNKVSAPKESFFKDNHCPTQPYVPSDSEKPYMLYDGKWKPWPTKDREALKERIMIALKFSNNCREDAAKHVGITGRHLRKIMKTKFVEVDWAKDFPPPKSKFKNLNNKKRVESLRIHYEKMKREKDLKLRPHVLKLKAKGVSNYKIAAILGTSKKIIKRCLSYE